MIFNGPKEMLPKWPQPIVSRPSVRSLVKGHLAHVPPPIAPDAEVLKKYEEVAKSVAESQAALDLISKDMDTLSAQKTAADAKATGMNRWNNKDMNLAQQQRLQKDIDAVDGRKKEAYKLHNALVDSRNSLRQVIDQYEESCVKYNEYLKSVELLRSYPEV